MQNYPFIATSEMTKKAYEIAEKSHKGAVDKSNAPYILHPLTVAASVAAYGEKYITTALLHDVVEDTDVTISDLKNLFPDEIVQALKLLTYDNHTKYIDYVQSIKDSGNDIAIRVKIADLNHNMDISRITNPSQRDYDRIEKKYKPALEILLPI